MSLTHYWRAASITYISLNLSALCCNWFSQLHFYLAVHHSPISTSPSPQFTYGCAHVRNLTYNSTHSTLGSLMPTLSPKLNLTLIPTLTLTNPTNLNRNSRTIKTRLISMNKSTIPSKQSHIDKNTAPRTILAISLC